MKISPRTQQRIVHRYEFPEHESNESVETIEEISVDGGKVRLRTEVKGESCLWRDYKAICANKKLRKAWFQENDLLVLWVNKQPINDPLYCARRWTRWNLENHETVELSRRKTRNIRLVSFNGKPT